MGNVSKSPQGIVIGARWLAAALGSVPVLVLLAGCGGGGGSTGSAPPGCNPPAGPLSCDGQTAQQACATREANLKASAASLVEAGVVNAPLLRDIDAPPPTGGYLCGLDSPETPVYLGDEALMGAKCGYEGPCQVTGLSLWCCL